MARGACCLWSVWADLPVPGVCGSALRQVFFCSGRTLVGGTRAWGDELRFPKTIPWGDIGV